MSISSRATTNKSWAPSMWVLSLWSHTSNSLLDNLAKSAQFSEWQAAAHIFNDAPSSDAKEKFKKLSEFTLPCAILQSEDAKHKDTYCTQDTFYNTLFGWAATQPESMVDDDVHDIAHFAMPLYMSFFHLHHSVKNHAVELAQRHAIDDIMEIAFMGRKGSIHSVLLESRLRLRVAKPSVIVGAKAAADLLVLIPFPEDLWGRITDIEDSNTAKDILDRAFWNAEGFSRSPTLPHFVGEFKRNTSNMNWNQLVMDMGTFQSQLQALSINTILWGGTYFDGKFKIFSSHRCGPKMVISSHAILMLMDPVNFLKCYSFMCNLALDMWPFLDSIKSTSATEILLLMKATAWCAPSWPSTVTNIKYKALLTLDVGHKHRKPDSDSNGGSSNGRTDGRSHPKCAKMEGDNVHEVAEDKNGHSSGGTGKAKACAGGSGKDDDSQASGGSATISEEWRIERQMARQWKSG
ncbi:hypothetical protein PILCRDRAFT_8576 [Piloderma croceum F 1598]|uniref:Uncharacterized protein n=1 Tax=Piloderma croceum (strain F 1598) TaxID=765440 RepID=A0A0C3B5J4_PILCF|nr:hypothetical protein PILCRDRAFT_8576 [Piloderma croceum F 1598]